MVLGFRRWNKICGAESGALMLAKPDIAPELAALIRAWDTLPEAIRRAIVGLANHWKTVWHGDSVQIEPRSDPPTGSVEREFFANARQEAE